MATETSKENKQFLDFFTYEITSPAPPPSQEVTVFKNCQLLKPIGQFQPGEKVDAITVSVEFIIWKGNEDMEDTTINL